MRFAGLILGFLLTFDGWSQAVNPSTERYLEGFLATTGQDAGTKPFLQHLKDLQAKKRKGRSELEFVQYAFRSTHKRFLHTFTPEANFASIFESGSYNCLTATILYSLLLSEFSIPHQVIETNYHIFILVNTQEEQLLLETTDPLNGFVTGQMEISQRIEAYKAAPPATNGRQTDLNYYRFSFDLYNPVTTSELTGLLYYNMAIEAYNKQRLAQAVLYLDEAIGRYSSPRIEELATLMLITVHESKMSPDDKSVYKRKLQGIRFKAMPVVASLR